MLLISVICLDTGTARLSLETHVLYRVSALLPDDASTVSHMGLACRGKKYILSEMSAWGLWFRTKRTAHPRRRSRVLLVVGAVKVQAVIVLVCEAVRELDSFFVR